MSLKIFAHNKKSNNINIALGDSQTEKLFGTLEKINSNTNSIKKEFKKINTKLDEFDRRITKLEEGK